MPALLSSDPNNLFIALADRELNPTLHILLLAEEVSSEKRIQQAGADQVVNSFSSPRKQIADDILKITGQSINRKKVIPESILFRNESKCGKASAWRGRLSKKVPSKIGKDMIGFRSKDRDTIFPNSELKIQTADRLLVTEEERDTEIRQSRRPSEPQKVMIVDDNPVTPRLKVRLFQKAGFNPPTATDGREGYELIFGEKTSCRHNRFYAT